MRKRSRKKAETLTDWIEDPRELVEGLLATATPMEKKLLVDFILTRHHQRRIKREGRTKDFLVDEDGDLCNENGRKLEIRLEIEDWNVLEQELNARRTKSSFEK